MPDLWRAFFEEYGLTADEQLDLKSAGLRNEVLNGQREKALAWLVKDRGERLRDHRPNPTDSRPAKEDRPVVGGTKAEWRAARALARLSARRAEADPNVRDIRKMVIGQREPLSPAKAWAMLRSLPKSDAPGHYFTFPEKGRDRLIYVRADGAVGSLWVWAKTMERLYHWSADDAAWWVLTGAPPRLAPVRVQIRLYENQGSGDLIGATITATAVPSTSRESISATVESARRRLFEARRGALPVRRAVMREFVRLEDIDPNGARTWPKRFEEWSNFAPREWHYDDWQAMRRDGTRVPERPRSR